MSYYDLILDKIQTIKNKYPSLTDVPDNYAFNALVVKSKFYKNPEYELDDSDFANIIVDGTGDGGVDVLLSDPDSEASDLIIGQAKFYQTINYDKCRDAVIKMVDFYLDMTHGHYENVDQRVQSRYLSLDAELGDESKIIFVLFVSAPKNRISVKRLKSSFHSKLADQSKYELQVLFDEDIVEEINEAESRRATVESGVIVIDGNNNKLVYDDIAAMVSVSALSIKRLYAQYHTNILSKNLRYHVTGAEVDNAIENSINNSPEQFWLKNNGITIICDEFEFEDNTVRLTNFSIVNGGQTTYILSRNKNISEEYDLYLPCKIVRVLGQNEDEKADFILEIAKATNSQKPIKQADLRANAPEQLTFSSAMLDVGVYYQTKRGEEIPLAYKKKFLHSDLAGIGKLCLSSIFQMPGTSRNKPSTIYSDSFYDPIFKGENLHQRQVARLCKELLYIDFYYRNKFIDQYKNEISGDLESETKIQFANNARTVCTAFVMLASRYHQGNLNNDSLRVLFNAARNDDLSDNSQVYDAVVNIQGVEYVLPIDYSDTQEEYERTLYELFKMIIKHGAHDLSTLKENNDSINASNYLKKDKSYFDILRRNWDEIYSGITRVFSNM